MILVRYIKGIQQVKPQVFSHYIKLIRTSIFGQNLKKIVFLIEPFTNQTRERSQVDIGVTNIFW
jgi:hypothetical protein